MKKLSFLCVAALLGVTIWACGGGDKKSAQNPNNADFSNPTGTLTEENANDVGNAVASAGGTGGATNPFGFVSLSKIPAKLKKPTPFNAISEADAQACIETNNSNYTIDWECVYDLDTTDQCTGEGTTSYEFNDSDDFYTYTYNGFSVDCGSDFDFSCDGTINVATQSLAYCADFSCTVGTESFDFNGCVSADGDYLVTVDGETFVADGVNLSEDCTTLTTDVTDSDDTVTMTCDVSDAEDSCTSLDDVLAVDNCTLSN